MATYKNPWHKPNQPMYGPAMYETDAKPTEYKGHLIYQRIEGHVWDVVKDGVCLTQRAGLRGAREYIDHTATPQQKMQAKLESLGLPYQGNQVLRLANHGHGMVRRGREEMACDSV